MSDNVISEETNDLYPNNLTFGKKTLAKLSTQKNQFEILTNLNQVYTNFPSLSNATKGQLYINPDNLRVSLGSARVRTTKGDWSGQTKNYNIFLNTIAVEDNGSVIEPSNPNTPDSGGGENQGDTPTNPNPPETGGDENQGDNNEIIIVNNTGLQYYQLKELLQVFEVVYSDTTKNVHNTGSENSENTQTIVGFSYKFDYGRTIEKLNKLQMKTNEETPNGDIYCVIRKCKEMYESGGASYNPPRYITQYLQDSQVISVSKSPAKINNGFYEWFFSKNFSLQHATNNVVYLITFHTKKEQKWDSDSLTGVEVNVSNESNVESKLQYIWDISLTPTNSLASATFSYNAPIGAIIKE